MINFCARNYMVAFNGIALSGFSGRIRWQKGVRRIAARGQNWPNQSNKWPVVIDGEGAVQTNARAHASRRVVVFSLFFSPKHNCFSQSRLAWFLLIGACAEPWCFFLCSRLESMKERRALQHRYLNIILSHNDKISEWIILIMSFEMIKAPLPNVSKTFCSKSARGRVKVRPRSARAASERIFPSSDREKRRERKISATLKGWKITFSLRHLRRKHIQRLNLTDTKIN